MNRLLSGGARGSRPGRRPAAIADEDHHDRVVGPPSGVMPPDLDFVLKVAIGGMEEVALGNLPAQKAGAAQVKRLAQHIVQENTVANEDLMAVAGRKGIQIPASTSVVSQTVAASMSELNGPRFDMAYVMQQHGAHLATIAMFDHATKHAMDPDVRAFARKHLPKIQAHTAQIEKAMQAMM